MNIDYFAGFFDGEGCIGIYTNGQKHSHNLSVQITQKQSVLTERLLREVLMTYGGSISTNLKYGKFYHLHYSISGNNAYKLLKDIKSKLKLKKEQAQVAIDWYKARPKVARNAKGQIMPHDKSVYAADKRVANRLKELK